MIAGNELPFGPEYVLIKKRIDIGVGANAIVILLALVLGVPRFIHGTSDETGGWTEDYETSSTASGPLSLRTHTDSLPGPYEDGASESPDSLIGPERQEPWMPMAAVHLNQTGGLWVDDRVP